MTDVAITFHLPERLVKDARALGVLSDEHIAQLLRADIEAQISAMASDPDILREIAEIEAEFAVTEEDGLDAE